MISGNVPSHLVATARTGFLNSVRENSYPYPLFTEEFEMNQASQPLTDLGGAPMPVRSGSGLTRQEMVERSITLGVVDWDITVGFSWNAAEDDQTGELERKVKDAGNNFNKHMNKLAFQALNGGDGSTYGVAYDGLSFFNNSHIDDGAHYQTAQDNVYDLALNVTNFETVWAAARNFLDDQGEPVDYEYDLLIVNPSNRYAAAQIADNPNTEGTANRDINPNEGAISYRTSPYFDTNAWVVVASSAPIKPLIMAVKTRPFLQHAWFVPDDEDGGQYKFKFYARYDIYYGDWRTAIMGKS